MLFKNKVALITGAGQGFGYAFAEAILAEGGSAAILDVLPERAEKAAGELRRLGPTLALSCDVTDEAGFTAAAARTAKDLGGIDILINNAGRHLKEFNVPCLELPLAKWRDMLDVNVVAVINGAKACRPYMKARGGGVILGISSISGVKTETPYGISKLAVRGLTIALAKELGKDGIRVVCIAPGLTRTGAAVDEFDEEFFRKYREEYQLINRNAEMSDVVEAMKYLCSDRARMVTGEMIMTGGGAPLRL